MVADFGIAQAIDAAGGERLTETGLTLGTPAYMSPEQAAGEREVDGRSDIYSLACVLYEMLAGEPPFTGLTARAVLARHTIDPVPPLRTVRPGAPARSSGRSRRRSPRCRPIAIPALPNSRQRWQLGRANRMPAPHEPGAVGRSVAVSRSGSCSCCSSD